ncbi:aminodeoxychorismate/anthranilate synthase component II [Thalassotalea nanhaiensis]|uniref:Aminodeoxychorismate/anthranilate synthase component II n=1 Tax=Thalassotalea nanhaiensis TaxID=3065648 RepID=A0ABY9TJR4_9GAMM|nr:aminodeoxychorismate/anthranilate synthase component II [Colwelliaceae bacterium SQ345]
MLLMIDNYDSFTFNLVHYFQHLGEEVIVVRNDEITINQIREMAPDHIVISPGPCDPASAGLSLEIIDKFSGVIPILGVCLGHQCIAQYFGGVVEKAKQVMHGKTSLIKHNNESVFIGLNNPLQVTRYHSLVVNKQLLPDTLKITAWTETKQGDMDEIMGVAHKTLPIMGVQFHPESILTEQGHQLLNNFLKLTTN